MIARQFIRLLCHFLLLTITAIPEISGQTRRIDLTGIVASSSGTPLAGATVRASPGATTTDESGHYTLKGALYDSKACCVVRFHHEGYRPVTKVIDQSIRRLDVALTLTDTKWIPPTENESNSERIGFSLRVSVPSGTKVVKHEDVDYSMINVVFGSGKNPELLEMAWGTNWSNGIMPKEFLIPLIEISERNMDCGPNGFDIKGRNKKGRWFRVTGMGTNDQTGETIIYRNVSEKAAKFFDSLIDELHCDQELILAGYGRWGRKH